MPETVSEVGYSKRRIELITSARATYSPALVDRYADHLLRTDRLVDELVRAASSRPRGEGWRELHRVLSGSADDDMAPQLRAVLDRASGASWLDADRLERGAVVWWRTGLLIVPAMLHVVLEQYSFADLARPLAANARFLRDSGRRVEETLAWVMAATEPGGILPGSPAHRETVRISVLHGALRQQLRRSGWDDAELAAPINETGMAHTALGFAIEPIRAARAAGAHITDEEWSDVLHLWRWIGHLMGVPSELVPEDPTTANEGYDICRAIFLDPDDGAERLIEATKAGALRVDNALPRRIGQRWRPALRRAISTGALSVGATWHHPRLAEVTSIPRGPARHLPRLTAPVVAALDGARRRGWRGSDEAIAARTRGYVAATVSRLGAERSAAALSDLEVRPEM